MFIENLNFHNEKETPMKHIVDNLNNLKITFKTLDLAGRVPFTDSIELLGIELQYYEGHGPLFMGACSVCHRWCQTRRRVPP